MKRINNINSIQNENSMDIFCRKEMPVSRLEEERLIINGGIPLKGEIRASGAKNAVLPIMAATILAPGEIKLYRVPNLSDVRNMAEILIYLGAKIRFDTREGSMTIDTTHLRPDYAPYPLVKKLNASFDITGAMVTRFGEAHVPLPGGCVIGTRAVDMHLAGFSALGCKVGNEPGGYVEVKKDKELKGTHFHFYKPSVGATKNVMMASVRAKGRTVLENTAREPEVTDLANFLIHCGAKISGHGTGRIVIEGVKELKGDFSYTIIPDRIETGTYLLAGAITGGDITVTDTNPNFLKKFLKKLQKTGLEITKGNDYIRIKGNRPPQSAGAVLTEPYPGFPTDLQPPMTALLTLAEGISFVKEKIFDMRFNYVDELRRMGADIRIEDRTAVIRGVPKLMGAPVDAPDIRAGGALLIAALSAQGTTSLGGLKFIDRGYEKIQERLKTLGADIERGIDPLYRY